MLLGASKATPIFLIPNGTFFVELVLFVVVLGVVAKFILPPLQQAMNERSRRVREALQASDEGHVTAAALDTDRLAVLDAARAEARSLLDEAGRAVDELFAQARARGQAEHDRIIAEAEPVIEAERRRVRAEMADRLSGLVTTTAERVLGAGLDASRHDALIADALGALGATNGS